MGKAEILVAGGIWGYVIGSKIVRNGHSVIFYNHNPELIKHIKDHHEYPEKKLELHSNIFPISDITDIEDIKTVIAAVPAQKMRQFSAELQSLKNIQNIIIASKGIEIETGKLMTEVIEETLRGVNLMVLSGPNFAEQVFMNQPSITLLSGNDTKACCSFMRILGSQSLMIEYSDDIIGTQICGALKNIYAIGSGIIKGLKYEDNTYALYITKVLREIAEILIVFGGKIETLLSCAGIGDLMLTCSSSISRNTQFGIDIATSTAQDVMSNNPQLFEGYSSLYSVYALLKKHDLDMPILSSLYEILHLNHNASELLMSIIK